MDITKSSLLGVFCTFIFLAPAFAQNRDNAFDLHYTYANPSVSGSDEQYDVHEAKLQALFAVNKYIDIGAQYQTNIWEAENEVIGEIDLHKVRMPVFGYLPVDSNTLITLNATPGLHTDFGDIDEDDFRLDGSATISYVVNSSVTLSLGAGYGDPFGAAQVYPIGGIRWQATDELLMNISIPYPNASYTFNEWFRIFVFGEPSGGEWNVGDSNARQFDIEKEGYRVGGGAEVRVGVDTWFYLAGGGEFNHDFEIAADGDDIYDDEVRFDDTGFVRAGIRITR